MQWISGVRGMAVMLFLWVFGWAFGFGGLAELLIDPHGETLDIWPAEMAIPGFVGGVLFVLLVRLAEGARRLDQVNLARFTAWGVASGLVLGALTVGTDGPIPLEMTAAETIGLAAGLGLIAGFGTGAFFRVVTNQPIGRMRKVS